MCSTRFTTCLELFSKTHFTATSQFEHVTPLLLNLHWLPVEQRIIFKIALVTFKALHDAAPSYITELLRSYKPSMQDTEII